MSESTGSREGLAPQEPVNEVRAKLYRQLMEAQERIAQARYRRGVTHEEITAALDAIDERMSPEERREDLYLSALACYVEALGGRLEVQARFAEESIVVRCEPE